MSDENHIEVKSVSGRDAVREKAQQVKARQSRARIARISALSIGGLALAAGVVTVIAWTLHSTPTPPTVSPVNMTNDGVAINSAAVVPLSAPAEGEDAIVDNELKAAGQEKADEQPQNRGGEAAAADTTVVNVRIYLDYHSEGAATFQQANASQLSEWVREGAITLSYHPIALHTAKSNGTKYSLRAAAAASCVAVEAPESFFAYNHELLAKQPPQDNDGLSDDELASLAAAVGVTNPADIRNCIDERTYVTWARQATERALANPLPETQGITLTDSPTILVNGKPYVGQLADPAEFSQFVLTASSDAYYKSTAKNPTPSATPDEKKADEKKADDAKDKADDKK